MVRDNPAARLLAILIEGKKISPQTNCHAAWETLLNIEANQQDESLFLNRLSKVATLPNEIVGELKRLDGTDNEIYKYWLNCVNQAFSQQDLHNQWDSFIQHIDKHTISYLKMSSQLLAAHTTIKHLDNEKLNEIKDQIQKIINIVKATELSMATQAYLLNHLNKMLDIAQEYKLIGCKPMMEHIDAMFGHVATNQYFREEIKNTELGDNLWKTLTSIGLLISMPMEMPQRSKKNASWFGIREQAQNIRNLLPGLPSPTQFKWR
ncbi:MAG: hypothetical protein RI964_2719 [Pseudomonadota bacterium]